MIWIARLLQICFLPVWIPVHIFLTILFSLGDWRNPISVWLTLLEHWVNCLEDGNPFMVNE